MRSSILPAAVALAVGGFSLSAQAATDPEIAQLKAQIQALQAQVAALEERTDAQSDVNVDTAGQLEKLSNGSTKADTKGGFKLSSGDGEFQASLGGRIHFDTYAFDRDQAEVTGTTEFRRARLTLAGKAYGWEYKMEQDFSAGSTTDGFRDVYIAHEGLGGKFTIGHFKPYRSMEELTSSNEITMMERPFSSASGLYNGRQFAQGIGYMTGGDQFTFGATVFNLRNAGGSRNEGVGAAARATFAPINTDGSTLHFGLSASRENANRNSADLVASAAYAGRRGPSLGIATTAGASGGSVDSVGVEAAGAFGPVFFQSEYARATFDQPIGESQDVDTFYVMGSWLLTGQHKPYKSANGVFGSPKVADGGAWELTARYDTIENKDLLDRKATATTLGLNYYVNPAVRFMFNYTRGENELTGDETGQYALRAQLAF